MLVVPSPSASGCGAWAHVVSCYLLYSALVFALCSVGLASWCGAALYSSAAAAFWFWFWIVPVTAPVARVLWSLTTVTVRRDVVSDCTEMPVCLSSCDGLGCDALCTFLLLHAVRPTLDEPVLCSCPVAVLSFALLSPL